LAKLFSKSQHPNQVELEAVQGDTVRGYVAVDDVQFVQTDVCQFTPEAAWPTITTTSAPTTPIPTEPPDRTLALISILFIYSILIFWVSSTFSYFFLVRPLLTRIAGISLHITVVWQCFDLHGFGF
jgi:hypothetical protein